MHATTTSTDDRDPSDAYCDCASAWCDLTGHSSGACGVTLAEAGEFIPVRVLPAMHHRTHEVAGIPVSEWTERQCSEECAGHLREDFPAYVDYDGAPEDDEEDDAAECPACDAVLTAADFHQHIHTPGNGRANHRGGQCPVCEAEIVAEERGCGLGDEAIATWRLVLPADDEPEDGDEDEDAEVDEDGDEDDREVTAEEFEDAVRALADEDGPEAILGIPGVWEIVSEHYNNAAIDRAREERRS